MRGRPLKYRDLLLALPYEALHKPASLAGLVVLGLPVDSGDEERKKVRKRARQIFSQITRLNRDLFPRFGDKSVKRGNQPPLPHWYGWRWKEYAAQAPVRKEDL